MSTYKFKVQGVNTNVNITDGNIETIYYNQVPATATIYPFKYKGSNTNAMVYNGKLIVKKAG